MKNNFDVVIPLYNKSKSIARCLESIEAQFWKPNLVVVVDDGSTDSSCEIVKTIIQSSPLNIQLITQKNMGVSVARNRGVAASSSKYIGFLDADDVWLPEFLSTMSDLISEFPDGDLYCLGHGVIEGDKSYIPKHGCPKGFRGYVDNFFSASSRGCVANSSKVVIRRLAFDAVGGFPEGIKVGEDLYFWAKLAMNGRVVCFPKPLVNVYREYSVDRLSRRSEIPYPLIYFGNHPAEIHDNPGLKEYLIRIAIAHVAESSLRRDFRSGFKRAFSLFNISKSACLVSFFIVITPNIILSRLKRKARGQGEIT